MRDSEEEIPLEENENEIENEYDEEETYQNEEEEEGNQEIIPLRWSTRIPQTSTRLRDFITYKVHYPIQNFLSYENITPQYKTYLTSISKEKEPNTYQEAISQLVWCKAMKKGIWVIVQLPSGKRPVGCK